MKRNLLLEQIRKETSDETRERVLLYLNEFAVKDDRWLKDARKRQRNWWWKKHFNKLHFKYLRLKRKIKKLWEKN